MRALERHGVPGATTGGASLRVRPWAKGKTDYMLVGNRDMAGPNGDMASCRFERLTGSSPRLCRVIANRQCHRPAREILSTAFED
jgi:hypothetical protein